MVAAIQPTNGGTIAPATATTEIFSSELLAGIPLLYLIVRAELTRSKGEARRMIEQGAVKIGEIVIEDQLYRVTQRDIEAGVFVIRVGKKKVYRFMVR